jgi:hypothetical protein
MIATHTALLLLLNKSADNCSDICDAIEAGHVFMTSEYDLPTGIYLTPEGAEAMRNLLPDATA